VADSRSGRCSEVTRNQGRNLSSFCCMAHSTAALRHASRTLLAHARLLRKDAEAARARAAELLAKAKGANVSADARRAATEAAERRALDRQS
jgi:hypothetical protein